MRCAARAAAAAAEHKGKCFNGIGQWLCIITDNVLVPFRTEVFLCVCVCVRARACVCLSPSPEIRAAWAKERGELEANAAKVTPSRGSSAFRIERRAVTVVLLYVVFD